MKLADATENIRNIVIRSDNLVEHLKNDKVNIEKSDLLSPKQMKEYSDRFLMLTIESKVDYRAEYIEKFELEEVDKEKLRKRLVEFRTRKSKERKIPAYYIFTNQELENLLLYMPKSVDELKENGILTRVKIDLHGEEIVEIVNS